MNSISLLNWKNNSVAIESLVSEDNAAIISLWSSTFGRKKPVKNAYKSSFHGIWKQVLQVRDAVEEEEAQQQQQKEPPPMKDCDDEGSALDIDDTTDSAAAASSKGAAEMDAASSKGAAEMDAASSNGANDVIAAPTGAAKDPKKDDAADRLGKIIEKVELLLKEALTVAKEIKGSASAMTSIRAMFSLDVFEKFLLGWDVNFPDHNNEAHSGFALDDYDPEKDTFSTDDTSAKRSRAVSFSPDITREHAKKKRFASSSTNPFKKPTEASRKVLQNKRKRIRSFPQSSGGSAFGNTFWQQQQQNQK